MTDRPPIPASLWDTIPNEAQTAVLAHIASREQRIADLEAENADLRRRLAQIEHQLQNIRRRGQRPARFRAVLPANSRLDIHESLDLVPVRAPAVVVTGLEELPCEVGC